MTSVDLTVYTHALIALAAEELIFVFKMVKTITEVENWFFS